MKRIICAALLLILLAGCLCLTACEGAEGKTARQENAEAIKQFVRYSELGVPRYPTLENDVELEQPASYAIVRITRKDDVLLDGRLANGKKPGEAWTDEDIASLDIIVIAKSDYKSEQYRSSATGGTVTISSESVELFYYDCHKGDYVTAGRIAGHSLPKKKNNSRNYTITDGNVVKKAKIRMRFTDYESVIMGVIFVAAIIGGIVLLIYKRIIKPKKMKKAAFSGLAYQLPIEGTTMFPDGSYARCRVAPVHEPIGVGDTVTVMDGKGKVQRAFVKLTAIRKPDETQITRVDANSGGGSMLFMRLDQGDDPALIKPGFVIVKKQA